MKQNKNFKLEIFLHKFYLMTKESKFLENLLVIQRMIFKNSTIKLDKT